MVLECLLSGAPGVTVVPAMENPWDSWRIAWLFKVVIWSLVIAFGDGTASTTG